MSINQKIRTIGLPVPRYEQIRQLAARRNVALGDLVGEIAVKAMLDGEIPDVTPGIEVGFAPASPTRAHTATIRIGDHLAHMSPRVAREIAAALVADRPQIMVMPIMGTTVGGIDAFKVSIRGGAIALSSVRSGQSVAMAPSIAKDVARQLRKAADEVEALTKAAPKVVTLDLDAMK